MRGDLDKRLREVQDSLRQRRVLVQSIRLGAVHYSVEKFLYRQRLLSEGYPAYHTFDLCPFDVCKIGIKLMQDTGISVLFSAGNFRNDTIHSRFFESLWQSLDMRSQLVHAVDILQTFEHKADP